MMGRSHQCYIPSFVEIGPPVPERKIFEGFLPYMVLYRKFPIEKPKLPSFVEIGPPVPERKIFEGFLPYMGEAAILVM